MGRKQYPRLTQRDVIELRRAAELMSQAGRALHSSSWQGAPAVGAIVADVYATIAGLYNRAEPAFLALTAGQGAESSDPGQDAENADQTAAAELPGAEQKREGD